jgi:DNA-binding XRE family transcriptional regulator
MNYFQIQLLNNESIAELNECCNYSDVGKIINSLGIQIRRLRIKKNMTQEEVAKTADIALNAIKRLECGKGATISSMVRVIVVLGKTQWFDHLSPVVSISPIDMLKVGHERIRVSRSGVKS